VYDLADDGSDRIYGVELDADDDALELLTILLAPKPYNEPPSNDDGPRAYAVADDDDEITCWVNPACAAA